MHHAVALDETKKAKTDMGAPVEKQGHASRITMQSLVKTSQTNSTDAAQVQVSSTKEDR